MFTGLALLFYALFRFLVTNPYNMEEKMQDFLFGLTGIFSGRPNKFTDFQ